MPDLEVIVVDDGSTDDTERVVRETDPRAKYIRQKNSGPATARNTGFKHSTGDYVSFLDCDDEWMPGKPAEALAYLNDYPEVDALFTDAAVGNPVDGYKSLLQGQKPFFDVLCKEPESHFRILDPVPFFRWMLHRNAIFLGSMIIRREVFESSGQFDPELCGAADWNLCLRLANCQKFGFWDEQMAVYTKHEGGMSNDADGMSAEFCLALKKLRTQAYLEGYEKKLVERHLQHHLFGYAYKAYDRGDFATARTRFMDLMKTTGFEIRGFAYYALSSLPSGLARVIRRMKQIAFGTVDLTPKLPQPEVRTRAVLKKT